MVDFNARSQGWDIDPVHIERAHVVAAAIRARVPLKSAMSALEYGCGTGLLGFALQPYLAQITLADSSEGMLAVLKGKLTSLGIHNMTAIKLDLITDPLPRERFDLICTLMTLHHVLNTDQILSNFHTLLNQAGFLCIADLDREDGSFHGPEFSGHKGFDRQDLAVEVARAGFTNIEFATVHTMTREVDGRQVSFPIFLMSAEKA
jgi:2-polyprenyl-3-methyl-5-hydroxy-6-metoxy-1,4-benzoquinol methylase